ncbi:MAG: hypothetical protein FWC27_00110 [Firmicutes bacterium]|nr:hypothetical protein [Bacillota bacterium]
MFKVDNNLRRATMPVTIRFTDELHEELHKVAAQNDISFNLLILQCCKYALDNMEEKE